MHIKGKYSWAKHLDFMVIDLLSMLLSFFLAFYFKFGTLYLNNDWRRFVVIICLINIIIYLAANPYSGMLRRRYYHEVSRNLGIVCSNALIVTTIVYFLKIGASYSREVFIFTYIIYFFSTVLLKYLWKKCLTSGKLPMRAAKKSTMVLFCDEKNAARTVHNIYSSSLQLYDVRGVYLIHKDGKGGKNPDQITCKTKHESFSIPVIHGDYLKYILDNNVNEVVVSTRASALESDFYQSLLANGVGINFMVESLIGFQTEEQLIANIGVSKTLSVGVFSFSPAQSVYLITKRLFDIVCGLIGLVVLVPIAIFVKIIYILSGDHAKIFYHQRRVGLNGKLINIYKFRSMVPNAGEILEELLKDEQYRKEWEENQKFENDPRITRVGAFLRKTSIDELPQLINVLKGDMSLVGPRPLVVGELSAHGGLKLYEKVKPGITGWWGCNGRSTVDYKERLELEYYYVKNCSLYLDILCIIRTIGAVLNKKGAV